MPAWRRTCCFAASYWQHQHPQIGKASRLPAGCLILHRGSVYTQSLCQEACHPCLKHHVTAWQAKGPDTTPTQIPLCPHLIGNSTPAVAAAIHPQPVSSCCPCQACNSTRQLQCSFCCCCCYGHHLTAVAAAQWSHSPS